MNSSRTNYLFLPVASLAVALSVVWYTGFDSSKDSYVYAPSETVAQTTTTSPAEVPTTPATTPVSATTASAHGVKAFQAHLIDPVLKKMHLYSASASKLLLGTAIQESLFGKISKNLFQIEQTTAKDITNRMLPANPELNAVVHQLYDSSHSLKWNLNNNVKYEIAMARLVYMKSHDKLPDASNLNGLANFWKKNYNTYLGKGKPYQFTAHYQSYVVDDSGSDTQTADLQSV